MKNVSDSLDEIISMVNRLDEKLDSIIEKNEEESYKKGYDPIFVELRLDKDKADII